MKNNYVNKIMPLTLKQLKSAEIELKSRKNKVYDNAMYEIIECVVRVVKISGMDVRISDESDVMDFVLFKDPLRDAVSLVVGGYYKIQFMAKRNILKGGNVDGFGYQINNLKKVSGNQVIGHIANCLCEKMGREKFKQQQLSIKMDQQNQNDTSNYYINRYQSTTQQNNNNYNYNTSTTNPSLKTTTNTNIINQQQHPNNKHALIQQAITKYCKQLGSQFDKQMIYNYFQTKYEYREIQRVLEILSDKGEIMDLGLVYEWVGEM